MKLSEGLNDQLIDTKDCRAARPEIVSDISSGRNVRCYMWSFSNVVYFHLF